MTSENNYGGFVSDVVTKKLLDSLGITQEQVDKVKTIIDNIDVKTENGVTTIQIKLLNK
jgi:hypothetical protein